DHAVFDDAAQEFAAAVRVDVEVGTNVLDVVDQVFGAIVAVYAGQRRVCGDEATVGRRLIDALHRVLEDAAVATFCLLIGGFGFFLRGCVLNVPGDQSEAAAP